MAVKLSNRAYAYARSLVDDRPAGTKVAHLHGMLEALRESPRAG